MKYLLTGGGTGGHVYPALAIAEELAEQDREATFLFVGVKGRAEAQLVPAAGYAFRSVPAIGLPTSRSPWPLARFLMMLLFGVIKAAWILLRWRPHAVIGTGGYASAPIMLACALLGKARLLVVPSLIHEQNAVPGKLNRLVSRWASLVASTYPSAIPNLPKDRTILSGYPVRKRIARALSKEEARSRLHIPQDAKVLVVFGGSLGARSINNGIVGALPLLRSTKGLLVVHGTGRAAFSGYDPVEETAALVDSLPFEPDPSFYRRLDYLDPMADFLSAADLVVCRAGAGTLSELCVSGLPAVVVPKANLPGDHQVRNALSLQAAGAAVVLYERLVRGASGITEIISPRELSDSVGRLLNDPKSTAAMGANALRLATPEATQTVAEAVIALAGGQAPQPSRAVLEQWPAVSKELDVLFEKGGGELLDEIRLRIRKGRSVSPEELRYLAYRTAGYLASSAWEARNTGVKLAGLLRISERSLLLASLVYERRKQITWWHRLTHTEFRENDFIRRNSLISLSEIGVWNHHVREAIVVGLADSYFEIRSAAARAVGAFPEAASRDEEVTGLLKSLLKDPRFEVRQAALLAIGEVGDSSAWASVITPFFSEPNWKVRAAALNALRRLVERGQLTVGDMPLLMEQLRSLLLTSTGFTPTFEIKSALLALKEALEEL
jgi:UDP-N-acetylglucosamine--N-acetylmuramyl-(pentapeptide) pyrophosphoryl-undecaprenol N-acetylglucosamine transferase